MICGISNDLIRLNTNSIPSGGSVSVSIKFGKLLEEVID